MLPDTVESWGDREWTVGEWVLSYSYIWQIPSGVLLHSWVILTIRGTISVFSSQRLISSVLLSTLLLNSSFHTSLKFRYPSELLGSMWSSLLLPCPGRNQGNDSTHFTDVLSLIIPILPIFILLSLYFKLFADFRQCPTFTNSK